MTEIGNVNSSSGFDPSLFSSLFLVEDYHFWFRSRNQVISVLVKQLTKDLADGYKVLEVGCGTGNVLRFIEEACPQGAITGMDIFFEGLRYARKRAGCSLVQADTCHPPFNTKFDLIGLFDVLEHLPDDLRLLADLYRLLSSNGALLLTVPAYPALWSYFDEASHHCRRYTLAELKNKLISTGYRVEFISYYMTSILPGAWLQRKVAVRAKREFSNDPNAARQLAGQDLRVSPVLNRLAMFLLAQETRLIARRLRLPAGTSLLAIARKCP